MSPVSILCSGPVGKAICAIRQSISVSILAIGEVFLHVIDTVHMSICMPIGYDASIDMAVAIQAASLCGCIFHSLYLRLIVLGVACVAGIDKSLDALAVAWILSHELLMLP